MNEGMNEISKSYCEIISMTVVCKQQCMDGCFFSSFSGSFFFFKYGPLSQQMLKSLALGLVQKICCLMYNHLSLQFAFQSSVYNCLEGISIFIPCDHLKHNLFKMRYLYLSLSLSTEASSTMPLLRESYFISYQILVP